MKTLLTLAALTLCGTAHAKTHRGYVRGADVLALQQTTGAPDGIMMPTFLQDGIMGPETVQVLAINQRAAAKGAR